MKKYTIIYGEFFRNGTSITKMRHIQCLPKNLKDTVEETIDFGDVWFILDGHAEKTND